MTWRPAGEGVTFTEPARGPPLYMYQIRTMHGCVCGSGRGVVRAANHSIPGLCLSEYEQEKLRYLLSCDWMLQTPVLFALCFTSVLLHLYHFFTLISPLPTDHFSVQMIYFFSNTVSFCWFLCLKKYIHKSHDPYAFIH